MIGLCVSRVPRFVAAPFVSALLASHQPTRSTRKPSACNSRRAAFDPTDPSRIRTSSTTGTSRGGAAHWSGDDCSIDFRASGDVKFNADFTDITSITGDGSSRSPRPRRGNIRRMTLKSDGGRLQRTWTVNGRDEAWDDDARRWLAALLIDLDRVTAAGVDYRFPALLAQGVGAVIDEAELMASDYPRGVYLRRLIDSATLTDGEYQRVVAIASRDIRSDYEMSRILRAIADRASFDNAAMRRRIFDAVGRMTSDYERSRVLQAIVTKSSIVARVRGQPPSSRRRRSRSDYERSRVLLAAIDNKALEADDVIPILETVTKSQSDYEKSRVLLAVAGAMVANGDNRKAYLRAADTIHSDYENRRVLSALVKQEARYAIAVERSRAALLDLSRPWPTTRTPHFASRTIDGSSSRC